MGQPTHRGACHLSGLKEALVIDVGGTTMDIGVLTNSFPRESFLSVNIGGISTHFRMPDILSIGIGVGTLMREIIDGEILIEPDSVGYHLLQQATSFGGNRLTLSDVLINCKLERWSGSQHTEQFILDEVFCQRVYRTMVATVGAIDGSIGFK
ncbi:MAG: hydantoinase/oxoprolinase family protein [Candidatus Malihini olakiniferum]